MHLERRFFPEQLTGIFFYYYFLCLAVQRCFYSYVLLDLVLGLHIGFTTSIVTMPGCIHRVEKGKASRPKYGRIVRAIFP